MSIDLRCKCIVIGDSTVGKTSLVKVLTGGSEQFPEKYLLTKDIDISVKKIKLSNSEQSVELLLFDCSGKEFYNQIFQTVWSNNVSLIVGVFDVTNEKSLNSLHNWMSNALKAIAKERVIGIVLGNKIDLEERVIVKKEEAHQLAKKYKMRYFECSAKDNSGIEEAFIHLINVWIESKNSTKDQ